MYYIQTYKGGLDKSQNNSVVSIVWTICKLEKEIIMTECFTFTLHLLYLNL